MTVRSEKTRDPHLRPASPRQAVVRDLAQGADTPAGIARRYGLPVRTILEWQAQGPQESGHDGLLMEGVRPLQSRMAGVS